jgi:hypothetical protein
VVGVCDLTDRIAAGQPPRIVPTNGRSRLSTLAREGRFDYLFAESTENSEPLLVEPRLGRRTALTFPLLPPPQKN